MDMALGRLLAPIFSGRLYLLIWVSAARLAGAAQARLTERSDRERVKSTGYVDA